MRRLGLIVIGCAIILPGCSIFSFLPFVGGNDEPASQPVLTDSAVGDTTHLSATVPPVDSNKVAELFHKAEQLRDKGEWEKALEVYGKIQKLDPSDPLVYTAISETHRERAEEWLKQNKMGRALEDYQGAIQSLETYLDQNYPQQTTPPPSTPPPTEAEQADTTQTDTTKAPADTASTPEPETESMPLPQQSPDNTTSPQE